MENYSQFETCSTDFLAIKPSAFALLEEANKNALLSNSMSTAIMITNLVLLVLVSIFWIIKCKNKG
jgi:hypothetical protein